jgi:TolB-like protein/Tfp pilus assembly protein PilF
MAAPTLGRGNYRFGVFQLDADNALLLCRGFPVKLQDQPLRVLCQLLERPGKIVTREELRRALWPDGTYVEFDISLNAALKRLRSVLGDNAENPLFIETIPKRGYRFIAPVEKVADGEPGRVLLVVLPFENLSGDPAQEYFSDGLTEEIITSLGARDSEHMGVIARTSAMAYKGVRKSIAEIGRELGASHAIEGSVRREGGRVRISAQLIRTNDQTHLWARNYDRELRDILAVQDDLGRAIAEQVHVKLARPQNSSRAAVPLNPAAYDAYLKGRAWFHHLTRSELLKSAECFEQAIALDPNSALPYAGLAMVYCTLPITSDYSSGETFQKGKSAARKALELDEGVAEAHVALCALQFWHDWQWEKAAEEGRKAIALDSNSSWAHLRYGHVLSNAGKHEEAIEEAARARRLDPVSLMSNTLSGVFHYQARRYEEALRHMHRALEINPQFWIAHINLAKVLYQLGETEKGLAEADQARDSAGGNSEPVSMKGYLLARLGRRADSEKCLHELESAAKGGYVPPYNFATIYLGLENKQKTLEYLERGVKERDVHMVFLTVDPKWDPLRSDARFRKVLRHIG